MRGEYGNKREVKNAATATVATVPGNVDAFRIGAVVVIGALAMATAAKVLKFATGDVVEIHNRTRKW